MTTDATAKQRQIRNPFAGKLPARVSLEPVSIKLDRVQLGSTPTSEAMSATEMLSLVAQMRAFQKGTPAFAPLSPKRQAAVIATASLRQNS